jgi:hypothetical protein
MSRSSELLSHEWTAAGRCRLGEWGLGGKSTARAAAVGLVEGAVRAHGGSSLGKPACHTLSDVAISSIVPPRTACHSSALNPLRG